MVTLTYPFENLVEGIDLLKKENFASAYAHQIEHITLMGPRTPDVKKILFYFTIK